MSSEQANPHLLSEAENRRIFTDVIVPEALGGLVAVANPTVHFFGGQPGAGKSVAQGLVVDRLASADGPDAVVSIIGDEYRLYHPDNERLLAEDDEMAAVFTGPDSGRWVEQAIEYVAELRPHAILEGTLRRPSVTVSSANRFIESGFTPHLHVIVAHRFHSRTRIFGRFARQLAEHGHGRYTRPDDHDVSYDSLTANVLDIWRAGVFETITLYNAMSQVIGTFEQTDATAADQIEQTLNTVYASTPPASDLTDQLAALDEYEQTLEAHGRAGALADLHALRLEVSSALRDSDV